MANPPPRTHAFLKWRFLADFKKYTHTRPPQVMTCFHMEAKVVEIAEKCQNPESWHIMNVPERYRETNAANTSNSSFLEKKSECKSTSLAHAHTIQNHANRQKLRSILSTGPEGALMHGCVKCNAANRQKTLRKKYRCTFLDLLQKNWQHPRQSCTHIQSMATSCNTATGIKQNKINTKRPSTDENTINQHIWSTRTRSNAAICGKQNKTKDHYQILTPLIEQTHNR